MGEAVPGQKPLLRALLKQGRKLDIQNPRAAPLGADFGRLGFRFIDELKARGPEAERRLRELDLLIDYRNAIGHGDEAKIAAVEKGTDVRSTKRSFQHHRAILNHLAGSMDELVASRMADLLGIARPW